MFRRRATSDLHRSSIRLTAFDAIVLAPVIALPLLVVVGLALFSMVALLILTGLAVAATIVSDVVRRHHIVGRVEAIGEVSPGLFAVRIGLSRATAGDDAGQLINMLFGNTSLQDDVVLHDAEFPADIAAGFGGPNIGFGGLRAWADA